MKVVFASLFAVVSAAEGDAVAVAPDYATQVAALQTAHALAAAAADNADAACEVSLAASGVDGLNKPQCVHNFNAGVGVLERRIAHTKTADECYKDAVEIQDKDACVTKYNAGMKLIDDCVAAAVVKFGAATDEAGYEAGVDHHESCDAPAMVFFTAAVAAVGAAFF